MAGPGPLDHRRDAGQPLPPEPELDPSLRAVIEAEARLSRPAGDGLLLDFDAPGVHPELRSGPARAALRRLGRVVWAGGLS